MLLILPRFFWPIRFASAAFGPTESPTIRFTKIPTSATQLPTAASACSPANLPTTATSAELNSCCKILLNANGIENRISFPASPPFNISISFDLTDVSNVFSSLLLPCADLTSKFFHILHSIPHFSYLDTSKDPCYHDGNLIRTSGSVVEYRLAKARVAGSNPVSCFYKS